MMYIKNSVNLLASRISADDGGYGLGKMELELLSVVST